MSKHTPGPWAVHPDTLMAVHQPELARWIPQNKEDARLIAAAPDLANVVAWLIQEYESSGGCIPDGLYNAARAAIAKAEG